MEKLKQRRGISARYKSSVIDEASTDGITLIALVITIIVLLILAGITINLTIRQDGILKRAEEAGRNYTNAADYERTQIAEFTNTADDIIANLTGGSTQTTPTIDILKAGDYIKYDSGKNGIITCRVLYPATSEYGLQIISDKNVDTVTLGGSDFKTAKTIYNNAIQTLNNEAKKYINTDYANDARCVGSNPANKDAEVAGPVTLNFTYDGSNTIDCKNTDTNYETDTNQMKEAGIWAIGEEYWLASRNVIPGAGSYCYFQVRYMYTTGGDNSYTLLTMQSSYPLWYSRTLGLRPCISLKSDIKIIGNGDGKSEETAYEIGK